MKTRADAEDFKWKFIEKVRDTLLFTPETVVGGSCLLNGRGADVDLFVQKFNGAEELLPEWGYSEDGDYDHPEDFKSYRINDYNIILCSSEYFNSCCNVFKLVNHCRSAFKENLTKEQRILLYEAVRGLFNG